MATVIHRDATSLFFPRNPSVEILTWVNREINHMPQRYIAQICGAVQFATEAHRGQRRYRGTDYITHPLGVAFILAVLGCGRDMQIAALCHDTLEENRATISEIRQRFGWRVAKLVLAMTKTADYKSNSEAYFDKIARAGAMILKLADRAHNHMDVDDELILHRPCWSLKCCESTLNVLRPAALEYRATLKPNGRTTRMFDWIFGVAMKVAQELETKIEQRQGAGSGIFCGKSDDTNEAILDNPGSPSRSTLCIRSMVCTGDKMGPAFTLAPSTYILFVSVDPDGQWSLPLR